MNFNDHVPDDQLHTMLGPLGDALAQIGLEGAKNLMDRAAARMAQFERTQKEVDNMTHVVMPPNRPNNLWFEHECFYNWLPEQDQVFRYYDSRRNETITEDRRLRSQNVRHRLRANGQVRTLQLSLGGRAVPFIQQNHRPGFHQMERGPGKAIFVFDDLVLEQTEDLA